VLCCVCRSLLDGVQKKIKTLAIKMLSTAGTGFFYTTTKNPKNVARKLSLRKVRVHECDRSYGEHISLTRQLSLSQYDPIVRQHVIFSEGKLR
jgi:large subunit ribosomal protein L33